MTLSTTMLASDLAYMIADLPTSVVIGDNDACNAVVTDLTESDTLNMAGVLDSHSITVHVPVTSLSIVPENAQVIVIGSSSYRIANIITSPDGIEYRLECEALTQ